MGPNVTVKDIAFKLGLERNGTGNYHCFNRAQHNNDDSNPSLQINDESFKCHGCGIHGNKFDLIKYVMNYDDRKAHEWLESNFPGYSANQSNGKKVKYHLRLINTDKENRFIHKELSVSELRNANIQDLEAITRELGKQYSLDTLNRTGTKIVDKPYSIAFPTGRIIFNLNNKVEYLHVEGRTDYLTAVELSLDDHFGIIGEYNKGSKLKVDSGKHIFILDADVSREDILDKIGKVSIEAKFITIPNSHKDLSDWFNIGQCDQRQIIDLINAIPYEKINDRTANEIFLNTSMKTIHCAQSISEGHLYYSVKTGNGIYVVSSKREYFKIDNPPEGIEIKGGDTRSRLEPDIYLKFYEGPSLEDYYNKNIYPALNLYIKIKEHLEEYIYFYESVHSSLLALWLMGTYIFQIFPYFPYLHFNAEKQSGKTLTMKVMSNLAFNGIMAASITPASIFRMIETSKNSIFFDEVERLRSKDQENYGTVMTVLNSGFERDGKTIRTEMGQNSSKQVEYSTYSPKCFAGINEIDDVLADRCIVLKLVKKKSSHRVKRYMLEFDSHEAREIRGDLYTFGLLYTPEIIYSLWVDKEIEGLPEVLKDREKDIWEPIFTLAKIIEMESQIDGNDLQLIEELNRFAVGSSNERMMNDIDQNEGIKIIVMIYELKKQGKIAPIKQTDEAEWYSRNETFEVFMGAYKEEFEVELTINQFVRLVNKAFNLRCLTYMKRPKNKEWKIKKGHIEDYYERYVIAT